MDDEETKFQVGGERYPKVECMDGIKHFRNCEGVLVRCDGPLETLCGDFGG